MQLNEATRAAAVRASRNAASCNDQETRRASPDLAHGGNSTWSTRSRFCLTPKSKRFRFRRNSGKLRATERGKAKRMRKTIDSPNAAAAAQPEEFRDQLFHVRRRRVRRQEPRLRRPASITTHAGRWLASLFLSFSPGSTDEKRDRAHRSCVFTHIARSESDPR